MAATRITMNQIDASTGQLSKPERDGTVWQINWETGASTTFNFLVEP
jgi:hypothetical protein